HPMVGACAVVDEVLDEMAGSDPIYMDPTSKRHSLVALSILINRLEGIRLGVIAAAGDVAAADGARSPGAWWGHTTRHNPRVATATGHLATSLTRWTQTAEALRAGEINRHQAEVITRALDDLPTKLGRDLLEEAEEFLLKEAIRLTPRDLRFIGERVLEYIAPDAHHELERQRNERRDDHAATTTRLRFRRNGDGTTDINSRVPDHVATRLKTYLHALTNPRRDHHHDPGLAHTGGCTCGRTDPATGERLPHARLLGEAFAALLEALPAEVLPIHGGTATTLNITINFEALKTGLGTGTLDDGTPITAAHARRLACNAGLIPAVLGGRSEVLDLGRTSRLYNAAQRKALGIQHRECRTEGCTIPARWCEAHHRTAWAQGGRTDLSEADLLCSFHHHRIHDPTYTTTRLPNGDIRFHRRT
ncbi:DUF222 domain-containing protein, partial [Nocardioides sp.]|uniref:DUF222 domain-containing protein n=1 Tax=Nocardioides sp. TaxID=35761 RepID=UPI00273421D3